MYKIYYRDQEIETLSKEKILELQLTKIQKTVDTALKTEFYKERLSSTGLKAGKDIRTIEDFKKIPFTTKDDLRQSFPYKLLAEDKKNVVRLHVSSGTTGIPTVIYFTQNDIDKASELVARACSCTGAKQEYVFQNMMTYGLFTGGLMLHYGAEKFGMMVIPASSGNTKLQLKLLKDFQTDVVHITPSYMLHLYDQIISEGYKLSDFNLKKAYIGAEPHSEDIRKKIESIFNIDAYNSYGLSEMSGPGVAFECVYKEGMHLWEDYYYPEIINPTTLENIETQETGELVLTTLEREATPLLRYRTRDLTNFNNSPCKCGRTHRRIERIKGRSDDMLIINGVNVFPSQIEEVIMKMNEVGNNYLIIVQKQGALDKLTVKVEVTDNIFTDDTRDLENLKKRIQNNLQESIFIRATIELHEKGMLPVTKGKAIRVIDERKN